MLSIISDAHTNPDSISLHPGYAGCREGGVAAFGVGVQAVLIARFAGAAVGAVPVGLLLLGGFSGGFVITAVGRIPKKAETFDWNGWRFEVVDMDKNRVDEVFARPISPIMPSD
jgi:hypothetical protein